MRAVVSQVVLNVRLRNDANPFGLFLSLQCNRVAADAGIGQRDAVATARIEPVMVAQIAGARWRGRWYNDCNLRAPAIVVIATPVICRSGSEGITAREGTGRGCHEPGSIK